MPDSDLMFRSASELAGMVRSGECSARELVEISLERIEELNPQLNAFVQIDAERALATAADIGPGDPRPFAGVPIAIKNNRAVQGLRLTYGCTLMKDFVVDYDHNVTRRLKDAGFVIVGTTTLPEYGILPVSEARIFGPTRNPWDLERTPGGSSGGAAAAVSAGLVPVAHGNDGGGSIRIPAACCGLVGLKPARGRISVAPELGDSALGIDGVLTRDVADTASILDVLAGYEPGDATWAPPPAEPFASAAQRAPGRLRIAATTLPPVADATVDPLCARAVSEAAELLRSLGHEVEEVDPPWQDERLSALFGGVFSTQISLSIAYSASIAGREPTAQDMEPMSWAIFSMVGHISALESLSASLRLQAFARAPGRLPRALRHAAHARARRAPAAAGYARHSGPGSDVDLHPLRPVHAVHAGHQRNRAAGHLAAAVRGRGWAAAGRAAGRPPGRRGGAAWHSQRSCKRQYRGPTGARRSRPRSVSARSRASRDEGGASASAQTAPSTACIALGETPSRCGVGDAAGGEQRALHQLGFVPRRERALDADGRLQQAQRAREHRRRQRQQRARPAKRVEHEPHDLGVRERLRARELIAARLLSEVPSAAITHAAASSAQIG